MGYKHSDAHTVATIRRLHAEGEKVSHLAEHFGRSISTVRRIVRGETYTNVKDSAADRDRLNVERTSNGSTARAGMASRPVLNPKYARLAALTRPRAARR